ncbi:hypothetical protein [Nocardia sputi]|uniref:hypothetical protein n=1 Tax=Nocardia sputi TaxID=2943705 RepID=UPI0020C0612E|nr:hypothetical protein [Nocardia sputi]
MEPRPHGRTRRVLARAAAASILALMPITAVAVPALASPIVLEPAEQIEPAHGRPGHRHGHGHDHRNRHDHSNWHRHDRWNHGRHNDWDRGRHDDWDHGRHGWHHGFRPPTGSGF